MGVARILAAVMHPIFTPKADYLFQSSSSIYTVVN